MAENTDIRSDLVDTAIGFLKNSTVAKESMEKKRAFLQQKGLRENEINYVFKLVPQQVLVANHQQPSFLRRLFSDLILAGLIGLAIKLFKDFFLSKRSNEFNTTIQSLQKTLQDMQTSITKLEQTADQLHLTLNSTTTNPSSIEELKREIQMIKGLCLSRSQFPSRPPSIPAWQLQTAERLKNRPTTTTESTSDNLVIATENVKKTDEDNHSSISPASDSSNDS